MSKKIQVVAAVALALSPVASAQQAVQWRVSDGGNGHWYQLDLQPRTWPEARLFADGRGGHLVTVTSASEQGFVSGMDWSSVTSWGVWMGARRQGCTWTWVTSEPWSFTSWAPNEPNGGCISAYLLLYVQLASANQLRWDDCICPPDGVPTGCVIEYDSDCNADGLVDFGQVASGQLLDLNGNNVPDCCEQGVACSPTSVDADLVADGSINGADLGILLSQWGPSTPLTVSDIDHDGSVNGADLSALISFWGPCP